MVLCFTLDLGAVIVNLRDRLMRYILLIVTHFIDGETLAREAQSLVQGYPAGK